MYCRFIGILLALVFTYSAPGAAEQFPSRVVRIVVPFAAGGATDLTARVLADKLAEIWRVPVIVDNRPGAGGAIGWNTVAKAEPSGHVLLLIDTSFATTAATKSGLPYDPRHDFVHIGKVAEAPILMSVGPSVKAENVTDLLSQSRSAGRKLTFGSSGLGSHTHLTAELFMSVANLEMIHVPYRGVGDAIKDVVAGHLDVVFASYAAISPFIEGGQLKPAMIAGPEKMSALPHVPSADEAGLPAMKVATWFGVSAPSAISESVKQRISEAMIAALSDAGVVNKLKSIGLNVALSRSEFSSDVESEIKLWENIARDRGILIK